MIDLTPVFQEIHGKVAAAGWSESVALEVATSLAALADSVVDWDRDAGESWVSVNFRQSRVAMVSTTFPLAVVSEGVKAGANFTGKWGLVVVLVKSFDDVDLCCDPAILADVFEVTGRCHSGGRFSANDLWFATV